jgi:hypothetical protein
LKLFAADLFPQGICCWPIPGYAFAGKFPGDAQVHSSLLCPPSCVMADTAALEAILR